MTQHQKLRRSIPWLASSAVVVSSTAFAALPITGGPAFSGGTGGAGGTTSQSIQANPGKSVASGAALSRGTQSYFSGATASPTNDNTASFVVTPSAVITLGSIGTNTKGNPNNAYAYSINSTGMTSGYVANATFTLQTPVLWDAAGNATPLGTLSTSSTGSQTGYGYVLSDSGIVAGSSAQYGGGSSSLGGRPVFWAAGATTPTPLGIYNTGTYFGTNNYNTGSVQAISNASTTGAPAAGTMVGVDERFADSAGAGTGADLGARATVWASGGGAATELANFGNSNAGTVGSYARVINNSGMVGGYAGNYVANPSAFPAVAATGNLPVRWVLNATATASTLQPLDLYGVSSTSTSGGDVNGINAAGDVVGKVNAYDAAHTSLGTLPALWKGTGTALTKLGLLGTSSTGTSSGSAFGINDAGFSVGTVNDYTTGGDAFGTSGGLAQAVLWATDGTVTNLSTLITTVSAGGTTAGWVYLTQANGITNDGWISGLGLFNPGSGLPTYTRSFLLQDTAVPEPTAAAVLAAGAGFALRRVRKTTRRGVATA